MNKQEWIKAFHDADMQPDKEEYWFVRKVFADWLEEGGETDSAFVMRNTGVYPSVIDGKLLYWTEGSGWREI